MEGQRNALQFGMPRKARRPLSRCLHALGAFIFALSGGCSTRVAWTVVPDDPAAGDADSGAQRMDGNDGGSTSTACDPSQPVMTAGPNVPQGYLHTKGTQIVDASDTEVWLKAISWYGLESQEFAPGGLWAQPLAVLLDQIVALHYNALELPYSSQFFDADSKPNASDLKQFNSALKDKSPVQLLDHVIDEAGKRGLRVILDHYSSAAGQEDGLWYTAAYDEERFASDWECLAARYQHVPTVVGFDLHHEPRELATWGDGTETDWRAAAESTGNRVLQVNPNLLVFVSGIETFGTEVYWQGGNLLGVANSPVVLTPANQLVYSAHDYPPSVSPQPWFDATDYPANLPATVWDKYWGYIFEGGTAPVWVGSFGTLYQTDKDRTWLGALVNYIQNNHLSFSYSRLNAPGNSGRLGGILNDDWTTLGPQRQILQPLLNPYAP